MQNMSHLEGRERLYEDADPVETLDPLLHYSVLLKEWHSELLGQMEDAALNLTVVCVLRLPKRKRSTTVSRLVS